MYYYVIYICMYNVLYILYMYVICIVYVYIWSNPEKKNLRWRIVLPQHPAPMPPPPPTEYNTIIYAMSKTTLFWNVYESRLILYTVNQMQTVFAEMLSYTVLIWNLDSVLCHSAFLNDGLNIVIQPEGTVFKLKFYYKDWKFLEWSKKINI